MSSLRILMVSAHYPPALNGYAIQCGDTASLLAARGHDVGVLTSDAAPTRQGGGPTRLGRLRSAPPEEHISATPIFLMRQLERCWTYRANNRQCAAVARAFAPDVAVIWQFAEVGIGLVHALQRLDIPVVFNVEDYSLATVIPLLRQGSGRLSRVARRWMYDVAVDDLDLSRLMLVGAELRALYATVGFPLQDMVVVHNGIAAERITAGAPVAGPGTRLLYVGRLHPTKGLSLAIEAVAHANRSRAQPLTLDIVGTGEADYVDEITTLASRLGVATALRFLGHRDRDDVFKLYRDYDILLFPSIWAEPFGLTVIEAMAQGVPVVALDRGGPKEIISHLRDGLLVPVETAAAFAQAIELLVDHPTIRRDMAAAAIRTVTERFTLERHVSLTEALLHDVVGRQPWQADRSDRHL